MHHHFIHHWFSETATLYPNSAAVESSGRRITYRELEHRSNFVAHNLSAFGAAHGDVVAIFAEDRILTIEAMLAILKLGCTFVSIQPDLPDRRIEVMLEIAKPRWAIVEPGFAERFREATKNTNGAPQPLEIATTGEASQSGWRARSSPDDLCYIFFTSGSTGRPKGIAGRLKAIDHFVRWEIEEFGLGAGVRVSQLTASSFDAVLRDIFVPLCAGGTICLPPSRDMVLDGARLAGWLDEQEINVVHTVPSIFRLLVDKVGGQLQHLTHVFLAGEVLPSADVRRWFSTIGERVQLVNLYGPSETTMTKFFHRVTPDDLDRGSVPIGKPMQGAKAILLNEDGQVCPEGAIGEIIIRTPYRSLGYYGDPELTRQVFVGNPFNSDDKDIVYKTGDLGKVLQGGVFEFVGRKDHQVKIRGMRVELAEVESALRSTGTVRDVVVADRHDTHGNNILVAYIIPEEGSTTESVRVQLEAYLPDYMIPSAFVVLESFPLTAHGKIDREALLDIEYTRPESKQAEPFNPTEEILAGIWMEVLKRNNLGRNENFFESGGHSLLATQVISRVRVAFALDLPLRAIFDMPTIAALGAQIDQARRGGDLVSLPPIQKADRSRPLPLSYAQQRLWFINKLESGGTAYNISLAIRLTGPLDLRALRQSITEIVRRHEVLRTVFPEQNGEPVQAILDRWDLELSVIDLSDSADADERERSAIERANEEGLKPFDLNRGPLLRASILRLGPEEYVFVATMHHIVTDGWSLGIISSELTALYESYSNQEPPGLPELEIQYADFAVWQRDWLSGGVLERQTAYWRRQLAEMPLLELPTDFRRPSIATHRGTSIGFSVAGDILADLRSLSHRQGVTLYMTLLSAFQLLLGKYSQQTDVAVGTDIANRNLAATERLIGFFVNQLVLRADMKGDPRFTVLLERVREVTLDAYANQDLPFERLVEQLAPRRELNRTPFFQVKLVLQNLSLGELKLGDIHLSQFPRENRQARLDLTVLLEEQEDGLFGAIEYATDLFALETMERFSSHFRTVLRSVSENPERKLSDISWLTDAERNQILIAWNNTAARPHGDQGCLHELFARQAEMTPDAVAVADGQGSLSYRQLDRFANQLAHHLTNLGVGPDVRVALCLNRNIRMLIGILGTLKAGGAYLPLDPTYPADRLAFMLEDSQSPVIVTESSLRNVLPFSWSVVVCLDADWGEIALGSDLPPVPLVQPENLAYVIYTSGSTGRPKGVLVTHHGACNLSAGQQRLLQVGSGSVVLQFASPSFDAACWEWMLALLAGARLVMVEGEESLSGAGLAEELRRQQIEVITLPPSVLATLPRGEYPSLRKLVVAGEACSPEMISQWSAGRMMINAYGPTETTVCATASVPLKREEPPHIGKPMSNTMVYVLDNEGQAVAAGVYGQLYVGGAGLARGYLGRADLTADRFAPHPFSDDAGARLYRTGDLVRWRSDGNLEFSGRLDHQVKLRGYRIELGEIEVALESCKGVKRAVVVAREDSGETLLVAYVAATDAVNSSDLRAAVRETLPSYMIPSAIVMMDHLPLTPNGKLDRKALPKPELASDEQTCASPRTAIEEILAGIFIDVLRLERVGIQDNFFELGGHSLLATQVTSRVQLSFGVELPLRTLFEKPSVAGLAQEVKQARREGKGLTLPPMRRVDRAGRLPLSFAQRRLWFIDQLEPASSAYNIPAAVRLKGALNVNALRESFEEIVRRHEVLRTSFVADRGEPLQVVSDCWRVDMPEVNLSHLQQSEREAAARQWAAAEAAKPFDLSRGTLLRSGLARLSEDEHVLAVTMHHIVSDGWSVGVLVRELTALYEAYSKAEESSLEDLEFQYADFAMWQREWFTGEVLERQLNYWRERLERLDALELPKDRPRPAVATYQGAGLPVHIPEDLVTRLKAVSQQEAVTLYMTLMAAFQLLMGRYSGQEDVGIGTDVANRNRAEIEGLIGFFVNQLVIRMDLSGNPTFVELMGRVREVTLGAYENQDLPFERLVEELSPTRSLSQAPLFQVKLVLQNAPSEELHLGDLQLIPFGEDQRKARMDITMGLVEQRGSLAGVVEYATELFDASTIERMLKHFSVLLADASENPTRQISRLNWLSADETGQVLAEWSGLAAHRSCPPLVYNQFASQAERTPDAVAISSPQIQITFSELNQRASLLAGYLRSLGVGPEVRVAVCIDRSADLIMTLLAILKAGAAYSPMDHKYPAERLAFMLEDSQSAVLIIEEKVRKHLPSSWLQVICIDKEWEEIVERNVEPAGLTVEEENTAYLVYTSGSTGAPKAVEVTHGALARRVDATGETYQLGQGDRVLQTVSPGFDVFGEQVFPTLARGATLVIEESLESISTGELLSLISKEQITLLILPAAYWLGVVEHVSSAGQVPETIRLLVTGGESVSCERVEAWVGRAPENARIVHEYGPTEATITTTLFEVGSSWTAAGKQQLPIGKPTVDSAVYVLDGKQAPVPAGVYGELYAGGAGLARGYFGRPEITAERFLPHPYCQEPGARLYRTGDLVRWQADGNLDFAGRLDNQVKVRGYRIELGEIEAALSICRGVSQAVVVVREDDPGDKRLAAYVVADTTVRPTELRAALEAKLPEYMIPIAIVMLEELPLTPNGKIDRTALPSPESTTEEGEYVAPSTQVEEIVAGIFGEVLKLNRISTQDNFFTLGGHSLLATQVISRVNAAFAADLPLRVIFEAPTIAGLSDHVERARREGRQTAKPPMQCVDRSGRLPLSFAEQRLWFIDQLEPGSTAYNITAAVRVIGKLNEKALRRSFEEIVRRHEVLRTSFVNDESEPMRVISERWDVEMPVVDLRKIIGEEREATARERAGKAAERPFDLSQGLLRTELMRLGNEDYVLVVTMHHVISDGWSVGILTKELTALYEAYSEGEESPLPELELQYADFAVWQREWLQGEVLEEQLDYWRQQLSGLEPLELPTDRPRPARPSHRGGLIPFAISADLSLELAGLSQKEGVTPFMTLVAAFQLLMARHAGQKDVAVGTDIANRNSAETESLIGFFVNQLVLRTDLTGNPSFSELLQQVREVTLAAFEYQDLPFERLVEELSLQRDLSRTPLFQVKFVLQNTPQEDLRLGGLRLEGFDSDYRPAKFDLLLSVTQGERGLAGSLQYAAELFDESTAEILVSRLTLIIESITHNPDQQLSEIELMTALERKQLLFDYNATATSDRRAGCVHSLFAAQAKRTPDRVALVHEGSQLSYEELNGKANQLAHYLQAMGVREEVCVGVCVERGLELVVVLLGVLKAGGAYVPVDASYPVERQAYMLDDARVPVLVTQESLRDKLPSSWAQVVRVDGEREEIGRESRENPDVEVTGENLAYVIYTSGSTGQPKGVMIRHSGLSNHMEWIEQRYGIGEEDCVYQKTPYSFDASVWEFYAGLMTGGRLVVAREGGHQEAEYLVEEMLREGVTIVQVVPTMLGMLVEEEKLEECKSVRAVFSGGEALQWEMRKRVEERMGGVELVNLYGPTETTIDATHWSCRGEGGGGGGEEEERGGVPIGKPVANAGVYVLDGEQRAVPMGVNGELYISGAGIARGYLGKAELTAERMVPNGYSEEAGARMYRTGDVVRWRGDGNLEFWGRVDHQVKVRGYRIELGEIEEAMCGCEGIRQAVVIAREDERGEKRLVGYVVSEREVRSSELRERLKGKLPEYMVPSVFVRMEELPVTPSGKLDRKALPNPELLQTSRITHGPRDNTEIHLKSLWEEVLGIDNIGIWDNFFDLGGHSLNAVALSSRLARAYKTPIPVRIVFDHSTIEQQAAYFRQEISLTTPSLIVPIQSRGTGTPIFCVHPVGGMVHCFASLARHLGPDQPFYGIQSFGVENGNHHALTVEAMAAAYLGEIRTIQPQGPYQIAGYSMGATVAYEMAVQLTNAGVDVSLLALLDGGFNPQAAGASSNGLKEREEELKEMRQSILDDLAVAHLKVNPETLSHLSIDEQIDYYLSAVKALNIIPADISNDQFRRFLRVMASNLLAQKNYQPQPYPGAVTLFRTPVADGADPFYGLSDLALGGIEVYELPGNHTGFVEEPSAYVLAEKIRSCLLKKKQVLSAAP